MVSLPELEEQVQWVSQRIDRALQTISAIHGSLVTGSVFERINGQILIPESVNSGVIAPNAITETKIDNDAVSTPKLQANSVTANKLETTLVLSTEIVAGAESGGTYNGVRLDNSGLRLYDGSGNQRGLLSVDGSGWLGSSTAFKWTSGGAVSTTGITVSSGASPSARVELNSTGLQMFNASNQKIWELTGNDGMRWWNTTGTTQRGQIGMDGSGWIGADSNTGIAWDSSGNVTLTGVTTRSGSTTARVQLSSTGLSVFNSAGTTVAQINSNGSGFLGVGGNFSWNTGGALTINANAITAGTLNATNVTVQNLSFSHMQQTGTLGADQNLGTNNITVNSTGRIKFGSGDYLANDILHFDVGTTYAGKVEFRNPSVTTMGGEIGGFVSATQTSVISRATGTSSRWSQVAVVAGPSDGNTLVEITTRRSGGVEGGTLQVTSGGTVSATTGGASLHLQPTGQFNLIGTGGSGAALSAAGAMTVSSLSTQGLVLAGGSIADGIVLRLFSGEVGNNVLAFDSTNRRARFFGRIYPGTGSSAQTSRYIADENSRITLVGATEVRGLFRNDQMASSGGSGSLPNPTKYWAVQSGLGATYYIPLYTSPDPWTA